MGGSWCTKMFLLPFKAVEETNDASSLYKRTSLLLTFLLKIWKYLIVFLVSRQNVRGMRKLVSPWWWNLVSAAQLQREAHARPGFPIYKRILYGDRPMVVSHQSRQEGKQVRHGFHFCITCGKYTLSATLFQSSWPTLAETLTVICTQEFSLAFPHS